MTWLLLIIIGISGGLIVGSGVVAFLTVLDLIPRLAQITRSARYLLYFQWSIVLGASCFTVIDLFNVHLHASEIWLLVPGMFTGLFIGLLAAALTEVINVIPILAKRMHMYQYLPMFILALALGKMVGSLMQWLFFHK
ncbi:stage V sporulation protein AB [Aneurinibacillus sp. Ricciae_BoGa-3]|uniref:stage V sporulation protein AB n=1 Tax=Aneurinibacillus sp. Ricciae_BoGa-3 TaxID=3022697 RepID=UPI00233FD700|nr:stage V sporulation protein AB [Aneurinibacillus sp. Ricciae_BoGa-3]WCK56004.1 stage V sporulation protein AB [Aneurinibacillus sp. Ricciae_BoGa-3]